MPFTPLTPRRQKALDDFREDWLKDIEANKVAKKEAASEKIVPAAQQQAHTLECESKPMEWEPMLNYRRASVKNEVPSELSVEKAFSALSIGKR